MEVEEGVERMVGADGGGAEVGLPAAAAGRLESHHESRRERRRGEWA